MMVDLEEDPEWSTSDEVEEEDNDRWAFVTNHYYRPQRSCGKVMFPQACVKNSVHGGRGVSQHALGQMPPLPSACWERLTPWADTLPPPQTLTATAADGTHPTGMHSCSRSCCSSYLFSRASKAERDLSTLSCVCVYVDHFWVYLPMTPL